MSVEREARRRPASRLRGFNNGYSPLATYTIVLPNPIAEAAERRHYALLQAAATVYSNAGLEPCADDDPDTNPNWVPWCVREAERLLAEIEKREAE